MTEALQSIPTSNSGASERPVLNSHHEQKMSENSRWGLNSLLYTMGVGSLAVVAIVIGVKMVQEWRDRQQEIQAFEQLQALAAQPDPEACVQAAQQIDQTSRFYAEAQAIQEQCNFLWGERLAQGGDLRSALSLLLTIPDSAQSYQDAQALVERLSAQVIEEAQAQVVDGKLDEAIVTLAKIPSTAPASATAENLRESWRKEWEQNEKTIAEAQKALDDGQWSAAKEILGTVSSAPYWQSQIQPLRKKADEGIEQVILYEQQQRKQQEQQQRKQQQTEAQAPQPTFNDRLQSLYDTYVKEGMNELDAWNLACETIGGTIEDVGPETVCKP
jgi:hypothetical protein